MKGGLAVKKRWFCLGIIAVAALIAAIYSIPYSIKSDFSNKNTIYKQVESRMPRGANIVLYDETAVGTAQKHGAILMGVIEGDEEQLGVVLLEKGLNGRYKISGISYGDGNYHWRIFQEAEGDYCVFYGRNGLSSAVNRIDVPYGHSVYHFYPLNHPLPFMMTMYLGESQEGAWIDASEVRFYDREGNDITDTVTP